MPNAKSVHCPPLPRSSHSLLLAERLGLRVEGPVTDVEEEEADGEDDARVLVDYVDVLDAGQRLLHHARPAFELKQMMQTIDDEWSNESMNECYAISVKGTYICSFPSVGTSTSTDVHN